MHRSEGWWTWSVSVSSVPTQTSEDTSRGANWVTDLRTCIDHLARICTPASRGFKRQVLPPCLARQAGACMRWTRGTALKDCASRSKKGRLLASDYIMMSNPVAPFTLPPGICIYPRIECRDSSMTACARLCFPRIVFSRFVHFMSSVVVPYAPATSH